MWRIKYLRKRKIGGTGLGGDKRVGKERGHKVGVKDSTEGGKETKKTNRKKEMEGK